MMRRYNRLLVAFYVLTDALLGMAAFALAYLLRFETPIADLIPVTKGQPPFGQYVNMLPFIAVLVPIAFHVQGSTACAAGARGSTTSSRCSSAASSRSCSGSSARCTSRPTTSPDELKDAGVYEVSQPVWALFLRHQRHLHVRARASSCAKRSSGDGGPASASSAC